jgi:hypothetical protein
MCVYIYIPTSWDAVDVRQEKRTRKIKKLDIKAAAGVLGFFMMFFIFWCLRLRVLRKAVAGGIDGGSECQLSVEDVWKN